MTELFYEVLTAYVIAAVITSSSLFQSIRNRVKIYTPKLKIGNHPHFVECRLCVTFWTSLLAVLVFSQTFFHLLPCYGAAYWLCTQER